MLKLLHRTTLKELAATFAVSTGCLLGLILIGRMLQLRDVLMSQDVNVLDLLLLFIYLSPFFLLLITPISCMLSVFLTYLRMSNDKELVALKAGGVGLYRLLPAPLAFGLACTAFSYFVSFYGLAWGMDNFKATLADMIQSRTRLALQAGIFNQDFKGFTFYAHQVDPESGDLKFVFVQDRSQSGATIVIVAPEGALVTDPLEGRIQIGFKGGRIFRQENGKLDVLHFGSYTIRLPLSALLSGLRIDTDRPSEMSWDKLKAMAHSGKAPGIDEKEMHKVAVEMHKRLALPAACLVLGLFALPIACSFKGMKQQFGLVLSMGLFLVYYTMFSLGLGLAEAGTVHAGSALWIPNALFLLVAASGMHLAEREREPQFMDWLSHLRFRRRAA